MALSIAFVNLGCRLNIAESDALASRFEASGFRIVQPNELPDVVVVNTCTVTSQADRKSRNALQRAVHSIGRKEKLSSNHTEMKGRKSPLVIATGCYVTAHTGLISDLPGIDYFVDNSRKSHIFDIVSAHLKGEIVDPLILPPDSFGYQLGLQSLHTRATVKIQDGCDNFCTFCIIPTVRGRAQSRPAPDIIRESLDLINSGYHELVLSGVNIGRYSWDGWGFSKLLEKILSLPGKFRVRVSSLEPDPIDEQFVELVGHEKFCPHLHICLQSGSDRVLFRMRREYDVDRYLALISSIRHTWQKRGLSPNFTTDIIVGFPGETDADFSKTIEICKKIDFGHIHTFRYSSRTGTRASRLPNMVPETVKIQRSLVIRKLAKEGNQRLLERLIGQEQLILVEKQEGNYSIGYGESYVRVRFPIVKHSSIGALQKVRLTEKIDEGLLLGMPEINGGSKQVKTQNKMRE